MLIPRSSHDTGNWEKRTNFFKWDFTCPVWYNPDDSNHGGYVTTHWEVTYNQATLYCCSVIIFKGKIQTEMRKQKKDNDVLPPDLTINKEIRKVDSFQKLSQFTNRLERQLSLGCVSFVAKPCDQMAQIDSGCLSWKEALDFPPPTDDSSVFQPNVSWWTEDYGVPGRRQEEHDYPKSFQCGHRVHRRSSHRALAKTRPLRKMKCEEELWCQLPPEQELHPTVLSRNGGWGAGWLLTGVFVKILQTYVKPKATAIRWKSQKRHFGPICLQSQTGIKSDQSQKKTETVWHLSKVLGSLFLKTQGREDTYKLLLHVKVNLNGCCSVPL